MDGLIRKHTDDTGSSYAAMSIVPGIRENLIYVRGSDQKLYKLFHEVFAEDITSLIRGRTGITRVVPVESSIPSETSVRPYEQAERMIRNAPEPIVLLPCSCRDRMNHCNNPKEVCLAFGDHAQYYIDTRVTGRKIDKTEALDVLKTAEDAGLVHNFINYRDNELSWICNCCKCCCMLLSTSNMLFPEGEFKGAAPSSYIAVFDSEKCSGCGVCVDRCQICAIMMVGDVAQLESERCIGCGLCVSTCPEEALALVKRDADQIPEYPENMLEYVKMANKDRFPAQ